MAISVVWTPKASMAYDPDDPLVTQLFGEIVDRDEYLYEWLGFGYTPDQAHNHDGVNSAFVSAVTGNAGDIVTVSSDSVSALSNKDIATIASVEVATGERLIAWGTVEVDSNINQTKITHNGVTLETKTSNLGVVYAQTTSVATGTLALNANNNTLNTASVGGIQLQYIKLRD